MVTCTNCGREISKYHKGVEIQNWYHVDNYLYSCGLGKAYAKPGDHKPSGDISW